jgi:hypothetical protein
MSALRESASETILGRRKSFYPTYKKDCRTVGQKPSHASVALSKVRSLPFITLDRKGNDDSKCRLFFWKQSPPLSARPLARKYAGRRILRKTQPAASVPPWLSQCADVCPLPLILVYSVRSVRTFFNLG